MIALGVRDLPRSVKFYQDGLGFSPSSASKESIAFFKMGGTVLALYPWDKLAEDAQVPVSNRRRGCSDSRLLPSPE
jgi:hypothetical protein